MLCKLLVIMRACALNLLSTDNLYSYKTNYTFLFLPGEHHGSVSLDEYDQAPHRSLIIINLIITQKENNGKHIIGIIIIITSVQYDLT